MRAFLLLYFTKHRIHQHYQWYHCSWRQHFCRISTSCAARYLPCACEGHCPLQRLVHFIVQEHGYLGQQQARLLSLLVGKIAFNYMYVPALPLTRLSPPHLEVESSKQEELVRRLMYFCRGIGYRLLHHRKLPPVPKTRNVDSVPSGQTLETAQSNAMRTLCHRALHHLQPADCRRNTMDHLRCLARC